jgi:phage major head subunit gpT-like protein
MGEMAAKWPDYLMRDTLQANPVGFDGVTFFNDAHPVNVNDAGLGTQDNNFGLALTANNYNSVWTAMANFKGDNGEAMGIMPNLLVVPPQLQYEAKTILHADYFASPTIGGMTGQVGAAQNVLKGSAELLIVPELANQATTWYLFDTTKPIKPLIFQQRQAPQFVYRNQPTDDNVFWNKEFIFGVDARGVGGVSLWFLAAKSVG